MTLRGYLAVLEDSGDDVDSLMESDRESAKAMAPSARQIDLAAAETPAPREKPTRPLWPIGDGLGLRPSSHAARRALSQLTKAASSIEQQLAIIEMLIAVGPEVREPGAMDDSLEALKKLEDELGKSVAAFLRSCRDVRDDGGTH